ncbi:fucose-1-phosphate guanylyltransferase-like [Oratosquilla oratoria]|uniref:fucose-1-phosphate guanylyltransferase-like n=1 Tax=Oratosquilla oratoria TaxID=337810 RepID=UPI003F7584D6
MAQDKELETSWAIHKYMKDVLQMYTIYRDASNDKGTPFLWDIVVLTTVDALQKDCFEKQLQQRKEKGSLPQVPFHVIPDPEGKKIGNGGSTLHVLDTLQGIYGSRLSSFKILIIHSGGSSKRLPSYSVVGKIFSPVPAKGLIEEGKPIPQMLDLKLAMYLPFGQLLGPGVFITCADDIETYVLDLTDIDEQSLSEGDVIALGHPSSLDIGTTHGVYVLEESAIKHCTSSCVLDCQLVLQKPSIQLMRESGALIKKDGEEMVYTDSAFWMNCPTYTKLLHWYKSTTLSKELDAYGHILPCLGSQTQEGKNLPTDYSQELFPILKETKLKVILLNESKFYHLGTMVEYIDHFCLRKDFPMELDILKEAGRGVWGNRKFPQGVVIESYIPKENLISKESRQYVIEYSSIKFPISLYNCVVSNCIIGECETIRIKTGIVSLGSSILYHTVPVKHMGKDLFVTVAFDVTSDMKKETTAQDIHSIIFGGYPLDIALKNLNEKSENVIPNGELISLWNLRVFPGSGSAEESFWRTYHMMCCIKFGYSSPEVPVEINQTKDIPTFSMTDILIKKDLDRILLNRWSLFKSILEKQ